MEDILEPAFEVVGAIHNGEALLKTALRLQPDIVITDISVPILVGIEAIEEIRVAGQSGLLDHSFGP